MRRYDKMNICKECREEIELTPQSLIDIGFEPEEAKDLTPWKGRGCSSCNHTGYKGRIGLYEVMKCGDSIRELILEGSTAIDIKRRAVEEGMLTLRQSGLVKIQDGLTTVEEVVRETVK